MRSSQLTRLNLLTDTLYKAWKGDKPQAIARSLKLSRTAVYRMLAQAEKDQRVVKSVERRMADEMRKEDRTYGSS